MGQAAAVAISITMHDVDRRRAEAISDDLMNALLSIDTIEDPNVATDLRALQIEIEVLVPDVDDLDQAQAVGVAAIEQALAAAGLLVEDEVRQRQSAELIPA